MKTKNQKKKAGDINPKVIQMIVNMEAGE